MSVIKFLNWDSNFFGIKVGQVNLNTFDEVTVTTILERGRKDHYDLLYLFITGDELLNSTILYKYSGQKVDSKLTYTQNLDKITEKETNHYIYCYDSYDNFHALYELAYESGQYSRFKVDSKITEEEFKRFYSSWIDNSVSGQLADIIFVHRDSNTINGFITIRRKDNEAYIGLIATDKNRRGEGIGKALLNQAKSYLNEFKIERLNVVTQRYNVIACKFYENAGFSLKEETIVYHFWL